MMIYKILRPGEWEEFESSGTFEGSPDDHRDGFIHCSSRAQLAATAARIFAADQSLVVATISTDNLNDPVRWEPSGSGELFPHIYGSIPLAAVAAVHRVNGASEVDSTVPYDSP